MLSTFALCLVSLVLLGADGQLKVRALQQLQAGPSHAALALRSAARLSSPARHNPAATAGHHSGTTPAAPAWPTT